tara:strand:+ start:42711 stop:43262 length:552 start_codon:yes stop_codon:yes gene_type:complete
LLISCTTTKELPKNIEKKTQEFSLEQIKKWIFSGRIGVKTPEKNVAANFDWTQQNKHFNITMSGPLGAGKIKMQGTPNNATLTDSKDEVHKTNNINSMFTKITGYNVPLSNIFYWIKGQAAPSSIHKINYNSKNKTKTIVQQGWTIKYQNFMYIKDKDLYLPEKVTISNKNVLIKIVIKNWKV